MAFGAIASIGSSLLGGLFGKSGAEKQNKQQMQFADQQAKKQMDFQERMSNTAHQREIKDLEAAGLNPILSGTGGAGASSPGGASGSANIVNTMAEMSNSARDVSTKIQQNPLIKAQIENAHAENQRIQEQTKQLQISNAQQGVLTPIYMEAGKAVNSGVTSLKTLLGQGPEGDIVQGVLDAAKGAAPGIAGGSVQIPHSAKAVSNVVEKIGSKIADNTIGDSEARKWWRGEKPLMDSIFDASKPENNVPSAKRLTEEAVRQYGLKQLQKRQTSKEFKKTW